MFVWYVVCASSLAIKDGWKWALLCLANDGEMTECTSMQQQLEMFAQMKQDPAWNQLEEEARMYAERIPKFFGSVVTATSSNLDQAMASITDGYMLSVIQYPSWPSATPINFDKLPKHFIVTLDTPMVVGESQKLDKASMLSMLNRLDMIRKNAVQGKIDMKKAAQLSRKVFGKAFGLKSKQAETYSELTLTCDDDVLEKVDLFCPLWDTKITMQKECSIAAIAMEEDAETAFVNRENAQKMNADYLLATRTRYAEMNAQVTEGGYFNCKDVGLIKDAHSSETAYSVVITKDGFNLDGKEIKKSWQTGYVSELLAFDTWDDQMPETVTVTISVDSSVDTVVETGFNISIQTRDDLLLEASLMHMSEVIFGGLLESKLLAENAQTIPTMNIVFDSASNWENVKLDLIVESKDPNKITYSAAPSTVKVTTSSITSRPTGGENDGPKEDPPSDPPSDPDGLSDGAIAGISIGCIVVVAAIVAAVFFFKKKSAAVAAEP